MTEPTRGLERVRAAASPRRSVPHFGQKLTGPAEVSARYPHFKQGGCATGGAEDSDIRPEGIRKGQPPKAPWPGGAAPGSGRRAEGGAREDPPAFLSSTGHLDVVSLRRAR